MIKTGALPGCVSTHGIILLERYSKFIPVVLYCGLETYIQGET